VASRWVWRLETLARGAGLSLPDRPEVIDWARRIDAPLDLTSLGVTVPAGLKPAARPAPCPPVEVRPRAMAVTGIETWIRDPYAIYARYILRLRPLDPPDAPFAAAQRGSALHKALEDFAAVPGLGDGAEAVFCDLLTRTLTEAGLSVTQMARESVLAAPLARAVIDFERRHRPDSRLLVEQRGEITVTLGDDSAFTLSARADRLELCRDQVAVLDFKTGRVPSPKEVGAHLSPQLTLTGEIVRQGGFADLGPRPVDRLLYVKLSHKGLEETSAAKDPAAAIDAAASGLVRHLNRYRRATTPFLSWAIPRFIGSRGDYDHLARLYEWHVSGADAEGGDQ
ncbi:MAG: PD-(D/E)XK nuclease family protein, partial [Asticcacaulis sp.]